MKITESKLRKIIQEELAVVLEAREQQIWDLLKPFHNLKVMRPWKKGPETYADLANIFEDLFRVAQTTWTQDYTKGYGPAVDNRCFQQVFDTKAGGKKLKRLENLCARLPEKKDRVIKKTILKNVRTWIPLITSYVRQHGKGWDDPAIASVYRTCKKIALGPCKTREAAAGL